MKIGIPRALLYYYYIPFWKTFFEALDIEVIISDETNKRILNRGIKESVAEICVPIKIFVGHAVDLIERGVDYIFVPRMVSISKGEFFCPKFMGLPDMLHHGVNGMEGKILSCQIEAKDDNISHYKNYLSLQRPLGVTEQQIKKAAKIANNEWLAFRMYNKLGHTITESLELINNNSELPIARQKNNRIKIGLLGYVYNVYDEFLSMSVIDKLRNLGVEVVTFEMIDEKEIINYTKDMNKRLFWSFSNKILGAGYKLFTEKKVDGIIHMTAFGCGPDSFLGKLFELKSDEVSLPFMSIRIDEHTGENHLQTRMEAFIDMLKRKKNVG